VKEAAGDDQKRSEDADAGRLIDDEEREEGRVSKDVFLKYFNAVGGVHICVFLLIVQTLWQGFQIASDFWLSHWTGEKSGAYDEERTEHNMKIYVLLGLGSASMVLVRAVTISFVGLRACTYLFNAMTRSLLHAPLRFFDANPIGRIINRYGDDMSSVDFSLPFSLGGFLATLFFTMCQLATAIYTVNFLGIFVLPLVYIYVKIANFCLAPSREISRLWKVSASPVLSHVTGSEEGVTVIRAFGQSYVERSIIENSSATMTTTRSGLLRL
jgi:ABC-type multidrug transport system fused ATPase/permease subunit